MPEADPAPRCAAPADRPAQAVADLFRHVAELREYATYFLRARVDGARASVRRALIMAGLGFACGLLALTAAIVAVVYTLEGLALGIAVLAGDRLWAGYLVVGVLVLALLSAAAAWAVHRLRASSRRRRIAEYEQRKADQRLRFTRDVEQVASGEDFRSRVPRAGGGPGAGRADARGNGH